MSRPMTRREVCGYAAAGFAGAALDYGLGEYVALELTTEPETDVISFNRATGRTVLVAGGIVNNGRVLGEMMQPYLGDVGTVVAMSYAETNVDSGKLTESVEKTIDENDLGDDEIDVYLNSAAGIFMSPTIKEMARRGKHIGTIVLDSAPYDARDIKDPLGFLIRTGVYRLGYSRIINYMVRFGSNLIQDPATDKDPKVPLALSEEYRSTQVDADTITYMNQAAAIERGAPQNIFRGVGQRIVYAHSLNDPIIKNAQAYTRWQENADPGAVTNFTSLAIPANSHAAGATHPSIVQQILLSQTA
jgi:hypothetical protein